MKKLNNVNVTNYYNKMNPPLICACQSFLSEGKARKFSGVMGVLTLLLGSIILQSIWNKKVHIFYLNVDFYELQEKSHTRKANIIL